MEKIYSLSIKNKKLLTIKNYKLEKNLNKA